MVELIDVVFLRFDGLTQLDSLSRELSAEFQELVTGH